MNCLATRKKFKNKHPAWEDPTEEKLTQPDRVDDDDGEEDDQDDGASSSDDDEELIAGEVVSKKLSLETKELKYKHLTNLNNERSYSGGVSGVQFHPKSKIALVTVTRGQADLYEVDGERNIYIQNIKLPYSNKPFTSFKPDGDSIVISSENFNGTFLVYDMISATIQKHALKVGYECKKMTDFTLYNDYMACRKEGEPEVFILNSKTYEKQFSLKLNEPARAIQFTGTNDILIAGDNGHVYVWDLRKTSLCKHRFQDEGSVHITSFALTDRSKLLSIGADCGIVNSYELDACLADRFPTPVRTFTNLKTPIDILRYNHSGELLLMGSSQSSEGFRMIHSHSGTVYKNFPVPQKKYRRLLDADFSPLSGYLALGCSNGRAHLCRLPYYKSY